MQQQESLDWGKQTPPWGNPYGDDPNYPPYITVMERRYKNIKRSKNKRVIIMRGLPGSGKSTYVKCNFPEAIVASADDYFIDENGEYVFKGWEIPKAHMNCRKTFRNAVFEDATLIVVDNTHMANWEYEDYLDLAGKKGYSITIICMRAGLHDDTPLALLAERNSHGVDIDGIKRMKDNYEDDERQKVVD